MFPNVIPAQAGIQKPSRAKHATLYAARDDGLDSRLRGNDERCVELKNELNNELNKHKQKKSDRISTRDISNLAKSSLQIRIIFCLCVANFLLPNLSLAAQAIVSTSGMASPNSKRRAELITLVRQDCGSCHGMTLKGGLGPALLPETLKDKPVESLQATILHGRPGTAMPPWQRFLTEAETSWIVAQLQKGFPDEK